MCLTNLKEGDYCSKGMPGAPMPDTICGDGLYCTIKRGNQHPTCEKMNETSKCYQSERKFNDDLKNGLVGHLRQAPLCDGDGNYGTTACIPGQNCFCIDENGKRIFGDGLHQKNIDFIMHCGCSRMNDKLKDLLEQRFPFFTIRCKSDGSFDPLQCFDNLCLCIDERTGSPTSDIKNLTMNVNGDEATELLGLRDLPCYDEKIHLDEFNYARPCEILKLRLINTIFESAERGEFIDAEVHVDICDPDGSYKSIQSDDTSAFCVDQHGNRIENFAVDKGSADAKNMDCKCARARKLLIDNNYLELPECCPNGNYRKVACRRGFCYCVDEDGLQVSMEVVDIFKRGLDCFKNSCDWNL